MKRVLLTGIAGAIGVHVLSAIMEDTDWEVVGLDSFRHRGYNRRLETLFSEHPEWEARTLVIQHDLVCPISDELKKKIGDVNYIIHLAALSDVFFSVENPFYTIKNNVDSTLTMLQYACETHHEAFVYFSTDEVYGPVKKGDAHPEGDPHRPSNAYSASKAMSEDACRPFWREGKVKLIITNTMNNFAPMQGATKFPAMVQRYLQNGLTVPIHGNDKEVGTRFYIHSRDTADALLYILKTHPPYEHKTGEIDDPDRYHIVGDKALSNLELAQIIADLMDKPLDYILEDFHKDNPAHDIHYGMQDNKLRPSGWKPKMTIEERLAETIEWQKEHDEWL